MKKLNFHTSLLFIAAAGLAAFVHSTWSLATFFTGSEPDKALDGGTWLLWLIPAALIAFAIDVGQVNTAQEISNGQHTWKKYITFGIFAAATYYLQWLYIVHHMPKIALAPGLDPTALPTIQAIRNAAIWILPALLPLSTLLYTLSHTEKEPAFLTGIFAPSTPHPPSSVNVLRESVLGSLKSSVNAAVNGHSRSTAAQPDDSTTPPAA